MGVASLILSGFGCLLSLLSFIAAHNAKKAAREAKNKIISINNTIDFRQQIDTFKKSKKLFLKKTFNDNWAKGFDDKNISYVICNFISALNELDKLCAEDNIQGQKPALKDLINEVITDVKTFDVVDHTKKISTICKMNDICIRLESIFRNCKEGV